MSLNNKVGSVPVSDALIEQYVQYMIVSYGYIYIYIICFNIFNLELLTHRTRANASSAAAGFPPAAPDR